MLRAASEPDPGENENRLKSNRRITGRPPMFGRSTALLMITHAMPTPSMLTASSWRPKRWSDVVPVVAGVLACLYKPPVLGSPAGAEMLFIEGDAEEVSAVRLLRGYMLVQPASSPIDDLAAVHVFDLE